MTVLFMRKSGLQLPGRCSFQISDQCVLCINKLINTYGIPVTWKALCQLMLKYMNMYESGGEHKSLKSRKSIKLCQLVVNTKMVSGIQRIEKGVPVHLSRFHFFYLLMNLGLELCHGSRI